VYVCIRAACGEEKICGLPHRAMMARNFELPRKSSAIRHAESCFVCCEGAGGVGLDVVEKKVDR